MIEREQGRRHHEETTSFEEPVVHGEISVAKGPASEDDAKARTAAFVAALDKVMVDHHNVLAALAK